MLFGLEWYWWVLIVAVVVVGGYAKLKLLNKIMSKKETPIEEEDM